MRESGGLRAFIAAELSAEVRRRAGSVLEELRKTEAEVKWVRPEAMHLTLRFLGEIRQEQKAAVLAAMAQAVAQSLPIKVEVGGFGFFPSERRPRVIWVGLAEGGPELMAVSRKLETTLIVGGFSPADKPFSPHLTLGRVRSLRGLSGAVKVLREHAEESLGSWEVNRLVLFRSELRPEGARYTSLGESRFGGGGGKA